MEKRMILRDGKEVGGSDEEDRESVGVQVDEEQRQGAGDFVVEYLIQGQGDEERETEEGDRVSEIGSEAERTMIEVMGETSARSGNHRNDQVDMGLLVRLMNEIRQENNQNSQRFAENSQRFEEYSQRLENKLESKFEEIKKEGQLFRKEIGMIKEENVKIRSELNMVEKDIAEQGQNLRIEIQENGIKIRREIEKNIEGRILEIDRAIEENLSEEVTKQLDKQTEDMKKEIGQVRLQGNIQEEVVDNLKIELGKEFERLTKEVENQKTTCKRNTEVGEIELRKEVQEMQRKLQEVTEEIIRTGNNLRGNGIGNGSQGYSQCADLGLRFDGNINTIHPKVFVNVVKNRVRNIRDGIEQKLIIRSMLTGHPLLWFCNKENQSNNMSELVELETGRVRGIFNIKDVYKLNG